LKSRHRLPNSKSTGNGHLPRRSPNKRRRLSVHGTKRSEGVHYCEEQFIHFRFAYRESHIASDLSRILCGSAGCSAERLLITSDRHSTTDRQQEADRNALRFSNTATSHLYLYTYPDTYRPSDAARADSERNLYADRRSDL
jgi:hypothetical protein